MPSADPVAPLLGALRALETWLLGTKVPIDLSIGFLPFEEETVRRARRMKTKRLQIPVATPEDLLILKAIAGRPRDIVDMDGLLTANATIDRRRVRSKTALFAEILEAPEILESLDRVFEAARRAPKPRTRPRKR